jgi:D-alanine-D-alanine ligase-like ATP-grasp enzyme
MWYEALRKKKTLVEQLLETQKVIEDVEREASQYLTIDTIALYHRRYYDANVKNDAAEGTFISTISAVKLDQSDEKQDP